MPRAAWLAIGAALGALVVGVARPEAVAVAGLAGAAFAASLALARAAPRGLLPLAIGIAVLGLRGLVGTPSPAAGSGCAKA